MGIFDSLLPDNPTGANLPASILDNARRMASLQLAASMLQPGIGRRRTFGEALGQGLNAYTGTQNDIINQALMIQRQAEQDALSKRVKEAQIKEYESQVAEQQAQADARKQATEASKQKAAYTSNLMDMLNQKDLSGLPGLMQQTEAAYGNTVAPKGITSMGAGLSPEYQGQYQGGLVDLLNQTANRAMDNAPTMAQQMTGGNQLGELALREGIANGKSIADLIKPISVPEGGLINPLSGKVVAEGTPKEKNVTDSQLAYLAANGDEQAKLALQLRSQQIRDGRPVTNVNSGQPDYFDKQNVRISLQQMPKLKADAIAGKNTVGQIDTAIGMLNKGVTGKEGQLKAMLAPYAEAIGYQGQNLNDAQAFQLLARAIIGPMRLEIVGPGPVSEWEQKLMQQISGGGGASKSAATQLLSYWKKIAQAKVQNYNDTLDGLTSIYPNAGAIYKKMDLGGNTSPAASGSSRFTVTEIR